MADEFLKSFLTRFNEDAMQIQDLTPNVSFQSLLAGLKMGPFSDSLVSKPASNIFSSKCMVFCPTCILDPMVSFKDSTSLQVDSEQKN